MNHNIESVKILEKVRGLFKLAIQKNMPIDDLKIKLNELYSEFSCCKSQLGELCGFKFNVEGKAFFYVENLSKRGNLSKLQLTLNAYGCPPPFYVIGEGNFIKRIYELKNDQEFNELVYSIFTPNTMSTIYNQMFVPSEIMSQQKDVIFESMEAYWLGMDYISTDSLITALEASLRDLIDNITDKRPETKFENHLKKLAISKLSHMNHQIDSFYWYPYKQDQDSKFDINKEFSKDEYDFLILTNTISDAINAFRIWFKDVLYKVCDNKNATFSLNRHLFLHGFSKRVAKPVFFPLMIWALLGVIYIESMFKNGGHLFFPVADEKDKSLENYFKLIHNSQGKAMRRFARMFGVSYGKNEN